MNQTLAQLKVAATTDSPTGHINIKDVIKSLALIFGYVLVSCVVGATHNHTWPTWDQIQTALQQGCEFGGLYLLKNLLSGAQVSNTAPAQPANPQLPASTTTAIQAPAEAGQPAVENLAVTAAAPRTPSY